MSDVISRADAINAFWEDSDIRTAEVRATLKVLPSADAVKVAYFCDGRKCNEDCSECCRTFDIEHARDFKRIGGTYYQQESAEAEWIPCSESLPKEYAQYLVCLESGECYVYWLKDSDWARGMAEKESILAWMPLPEPYRKDGEA